jgi:hypothetical protein
MMRTYRELIHINDFFKRFEYLKLDNQVGSITFDNNRWVNQQFYKSYEWKKLRSEIIIRDNGCDLAFDDRPINGDILIHHINPLTLDDFITCSDCLMDPDNLICVSLRTHNAIHYGSSDLLDKDPIIRKLNDTKLW